MVETIGGTKFAYPYVQAVSGKRPQRLHLQQGDGRYLRRRAACPCQGAAMRRSCLRPASAAAPRSSPRCTSAWPPTVISQIRGIVNGTTNFMLTKMKRENMGFDEALKIAQQLGYAETKDPSAMMWTAVDACRKIAILASLACGQPCLSRQHARPAASVTSRWPTSKLRKSSTAPSSSSPGTTQGENGEYGRRRGADARLQRKPARRRG